MLQSSLTPGKKTSRDQMVPNNFPVRYRTPAVILNLRSYRAPLKLQERLHDNDQLVNAVLKIIAVYSENQTKHINTPCVQNAELVNVKAGGSYSYHWALQD
jgi:hypothetical protein